MEAFPVVDENMRVNEPSTFVREKNNSPNMKIVQVSITRISMEHTATSYYCEMNTHMKLMAGHRCPAIRFTRTPILILNISRLKLYYIYMGAALTHSHGSRSNAGIRYHKL